jgi:hypothetical protein
LPWPSVSSCSSHRLVQLMGGQDTGDGEFFHSGEFGRIPVTGW